MKKIKWTIVFLWKITVVAFFALLLAMFVLNLYIFKETKAWLWSEIYGQDDFTPLSIDKKLLNSAVDKLIEKKNVFDKVLRYGVEIKDPSI